MNNQAGLELEFLDDNQLAGFRLMRLEIFNWGTFHQKIWTLELNGKNGLLTGDIGSGKSTVVDAITTLLVPAHRIAYNKAAGAENKERHLRSYVLGYYKSERDSETGIIKPTALRDERHYSVILGIFYNEGYDQYISLAQVFWLKEQKTQPDRFYIGAEKMLSIAEHFIDFGTEISNLRKRFRQANIDTFDSFSSYSAWFRRRFGIQNEQALELFHQTVSMKSVGNLTDFVRSHMLEAFEETKQRIANLLSHFDDLDRAYQAVLKAEEQVAMLTPIVNHCLEYQSIEQEIESLYHYLENLSPYFSTFKLALLKQALQSVMQEWQLVQEKIAQIQTKQEQQQQQLQQIKWDIQQNGGNRLAEIERQIKEQEKLKTECHQKAVRYEQYITALNETVVTNSADFIAQKARLLIKKEELQQQDIDNLNAEVESLADIRQTTTELANIKQEIYSLKQRESNISHQQIEIRRTLCKALNLPEADLPFIGELLQLKETEKDWEGAAERLLHNFALSLIVPEKYYVQVGQWVNQQHLKGRLVYYLVKQNQVMRNNEIQPSSLLHKLMIKPQTPYFQWLENELYKRFDYVACDSMVQFQREERAISLRGQIKDKSGRHEKDDRYALEDRSRYILGWSNKDKITALNLHAQQLERQLNALKATADKCKSARSKLREQLELFVRLEVFSSFAEIDFATVVKDIEKLTIEYQQLSEASDQLMKLGRQQKHLEEEIKQTKTDEQQLLQQYGRLDERHQELRKQLEMVELFVEEQPFNSAYQSYFSQTLDEILAKRSLTLENCDTTETKMRNLLNRQIEQHHQMLSKKNSEITKEMTLFNNKYPLETNEFDANVASYLEYKAFLDRLNADELPKFVTQFKLLLNENTINEIANLNAQLNRERDLIKQRIAIINRSLESIDYNQGRYISLGLETNPDLEIRQFQQDLRACTEGAVTGSDDNQYSEQKFLQVKEIVDRLRGRENFTELDKRWTAKVTDVRNWFLFSATERWRTDNAEYEHYSDSGGKSGGQKEKLAYTILAASLAYQFGLEFNVTRSRSFRFVMIDEAFGRGSDESANYGLRLFKQLNLQLLIVTPLQKIHIIEPFVSSVSFVQNVGGANSKILNLTIEEHLVQKAKQVNL
ncbi:ATP-dependent exonuclease SbcCD, C subunit-like protein [Gallibacterium salpingitidis]|uniref:ATP-binding protein n=1 Tax=Gallibacterium salpingitidis TaxID=505341 RepID=UPI00266F6D0F|nr:ATP-binding protein [Gallibacterium salpingitidis]WKS98926.1 ATP-dependent exonuclease SbcCD, C subunit-like protein [Gallibacterium salpingitidis]